MAEKIKQAIEDAVVEVEQTPVVGGAEQMVAEIAEKAEAVRVEVEEAVEEATAATEDEKKPMAAKVIERMKSAVEEVEKSELAAQVRKAVKDTAEGFEKSPLGGVAHRVLLAGIGAVALAQDEIEDFVNRLVERGEIAEADGKKMLKDVLEKRKSVLEKTAEWAEAPKRAADEVEKRVEDVLARMNIPSKDEIETLSAKITVLTKKVDELKKQD